MLYTILAEHQLRVRRLHSIKARHKGGRDPPVACVPCDCVVLLRVFLIQAGPMLMSTGQSWGHQAVQVNNHMWALITILSYSDIYQSFFHRTHLIGDSCLVCQLSTIHLLLISLWLGLLICMAWPPSLGKLKEVSQHCGSSSPLVRPP